MAIPAISATSSPFSVFGIEAVRGLLVRDTDSSFLIGDTIPLGTVVEVSSSGRLLASLADVAETANAAQAGNEVDTTAFVADVRRFVDSLNAVNLGAQSETTGLFDLVGLAPATPPAPTSVPLTPLPPGIDIIPTPDAGAFVLTLDEAALESAVEAAPTTTVSQVANFLLPLGATTAAAAVQTQLTAPAAVANIQTDILATVANAGLPLEVLIANGVATGLVPDLTLENAALRRAQADLALNDLLSAAVEAEEQTVLAAPLAPILESIAEPRLPPPAVQPEPPVEPPVAQVRTQPPLPEPVPVTNPVPELAPAPAATVLAPADLLSTPLEQIARLAAGTTVAGAVAAFMAPADDMARVVRGGLLQADFDVINPTEAVLQTEAVAPQLADNGNSSQRDNPMDIWQRRWIANVQPASI